MIPEDLKYTKSHEWVSIDGNEITLGITDYAQSQLGDITFVELPAANKQASKGEAIAVVESVKAASDVYAPANGTISEVNDDLEGSPEKVNSDSYKDGWMLKISGVNAEELADLMDAAAYESFIADGNQ